MLRALFIGPDDSASQELATSVSLNAGVMIQRHLQHYPKPMEMVRMLRCCAPECIFLSVADMQSVADIYQLVNQEMPNLAIVAYGQTTSVKTLQQLLQLGVREFLHSPFTGSVVQSTLVRVAERLRKVPVQPSSTDHLYTFLPSKPGVGSSTIALHTARHMAEQKSIKTLLMDCDLSAGLLQWMLKLDNSFSLVEAVERADELDDNLWPQLVDGHGNLDLLSSGTLNPSLRIEPVELRKLIEFARRRYQVVIADLSGNLERYSVELMAESKRIFLITSTELPALYLAGEKLRYLQELDLGDRVQLLVNRTLGDADPVPLARIEQFIGLPITMSFANDYREVGRALTDGNAVRASRPLGRQLIALAELIAAPIVPPEPATPPKRRLEQLLSPLARFSNG